MYHSMKYQVLSIKTEAGVSASSSGVSAGGGGCLRSCLNFAFAIENCQCGVLIKLFFRGIMVLC